MFKQTTLSDYWKSGESDVNEDSESQNQVNDENKQANI